VQPLSYARGLAAAVGRCGGRIFVGSPALKLTRTAGAWSIETPRGSLTASLVIIATNAYTGALTDELRRNGSGGALIPGGHGADFPRRAAHGNPAPVDRRASDTRRLLRYFRLDASGRLVMGSRGTFAPVPDTRSVTATTTAPCTRSIRSSKAWLSNITGEWLVAMTRDHLPHLHELAPGPACRPRLQWSRRRHGKP